jgi:uncharacterized membrane protein (UPF0127 family)/CheY-like chemotaxis protein
MATDTKLIVNLTRGRTVCVGALANRPLRRMRGLIGRSGLPAGEGLLLSPAPGIHTAFMRFSIDALFLDANLRVVDIVERMGPWRVASRRQARSVLELAAGESARRGIHVGDRLALRERRQTPEGGPRGPLTVVGMPPSSTSSSSVPSDSVIWPDAAANGGVLARLVPLRVLVVSRDRHFRSVTSMLLSHRGCVVTTTGKAGRVAETISRDGADVVVIDAVGSSATAQTVAAVGALAQPVGIVIVDESPSRPKGSPVLAKWGPFEDLYAAIERADRGRGRQAGVA